MSAGDRDDKKKERRKEVDMGREAGGEQEGTEMVKNVTLESQRIPIKMVIQTFHKIGAFSFNQS